MKRTGLAAEVPTLELCQEMAAIPALAEAFKNSAFIVATSGRIEERELVIAAAHLAGITPEQDNWLPASTVREMLAWLDDPDKTDVELDEVDWVIRISDGKNWLCPPARLTDPDALARTCIEAAKAGA